MVGITLFCAAAVVWMSSSPLMAGDIPHGITVRVYETAGLPSTLEQRAFAEAGTLLRAAFVDVRWLECTGANHAPACDVPLGPSDFVLVIRERGECPLTSGALGKALVLRRGGGVLATVNFGQVACLAMTTYTDAAVLLGRVTAHELGHLMMRTPKHSPRGLMRERWTPHEVRRNWAIDWAFTTADVAAMRCPR
jgi:hypothetical protein